MLKECQRCGTCCRKGPPALHEQDIGLYTSGLLRKGDLLTLRQGEWVYDSVKDALLVLPEEIVRLKAGPGGQSCSFLSEEDSSCRIYEQRPEECRAMKCWDPAEFEAMYQQGRIGRNRLIPRSSALAEIIAEHEQACSYARIRPLAEKLLQSADQQAAQELAAIIRQDEEMRSFLQERAEAGQEVLDFLFGRPLTRTLPGFGIKVERQGDGYRFHREGNARVRRLLRI